VANTQIAEAFGLSSSKSWYPLYFNTEENLDNVGAKSDVSYFGLGEMSDAEWKDFLGLKAEIFDNKRVLEQFCQADVTVLRQACQVFRRELKQIGNINFF
jgi:hypothetical protein